MNDLVEKIYNTCYRGDYLELAALIKSKPNLDIRNDVGATPLTAAIMGGHLEIVELLLKSGANPNFREDDCDNIIGYSPLERATDFGFDEIEALLLKYNAIKD